MTAETRIAEPEETTVARERPIKNISAATNRCHALVTRHGVWMGNWSYWTHKTRNYKEI
jgi:hypothetical protein